MKVIASLILTFLIVFSCKDYNDPQVTIVENLSFQSSSFDQKGFAGEYLKDSIVVFARNITGNMVTEGLSIGFKVIKGGGETDEETATTDPSGEVATRWKLGELGNEQILEASLYAKDGKRLTTLRLHANGFRPDRWDATTAYPETTIYGMAADTLDAVTYAICNYGYLLKRGERYFDWVPVTNFPNASPRTIEIGKDLTFYISTWNGQVYKSSDHGMNWVTGTNPWTDYDNYFDLRITSDNFLWATAPDRPLRSSRDGGNTWVTDSAGLSITERLGDIFRLTDESLFLLSQNSHLYKSTDDGHSWMHVTSPRYAIKLYVTENDELIILNQENGISIYKSIDKGAQFNLESSVSPSFSTGMDNIHTIHKWGQDYYLMIPGYGILHTLNFENFSNYWLNPSVYDMNMDHQGIFLARKQTVDTVYYRYNSQ